MFSQRLPSDLRQLTYLSVANDKAIQGQSTGEQVYAYASERATGSHFRLLPPIPVLAI
jgi:hypothetical protein